jgi:hypothetical protein
MPVEEGDHGTVRLEPGKVAPEVEMVALGEALGEEGMVAVVVAEDADQWGRERSEPRNDERRDVVSRVEHEVEARVVEPVDGDLDPPLAVVGV